MGRSDRRKPKSGSPKRPVNKLPEKQRFLIVCEGAKTEVNYFNSFRVLSAKVLDIDIQGLGFNTLSLVQEAIKYKNKKDYDQIWCVFDRNSHPADQFNRAFSLAKRSGIKIAYSNQSFELWYLLHYHYWHTALHRDQCLTKLSQELGFMYEKNSEVMYKILKERQPIAIQNAKRLLAEYHPNLNPERHNPSTTVHLLVEQLNKFI